MVTVSDDGLIRAARAVGLCGTQGGAGSCRMVAWGALLAGFAVVSRRWSWSWPGWRVPRPAAALSGLAHDEPLVVTAAALVNPAGRGARHRRHPGVPRAQGRQAGHLDRLAPDPVPLGGHEPVGVKAPASSCLVTSTIAVSFSASTTAGSSSGQVEDAGQAADARVRPVGGPMPADCACGRWGLAGPPPPPARRW